MDATYSRSSVQAEDVSLYQRDEKRTIALYASAAKIAARGRFYSDDASREYDVLDYTIDVSVVPERSYIDARARMRRQVRLDGSASEIEPQCLGLILTICDGRLAWQGTVDVPEVGIHTVILAATTGHVLFHKFDQYHPG